LKMAVVFGECGRECLSGPGNTEVFSVLAGRGGGQKPVSEGRHIEATHTHQTDRSTVCGGPPPPPPPPPAPPPPPPPQTEGQTVGSRTKMTAKGGRADSRL
jgi:hypothetical protein